jgi:hypothetical protein
MNPRYRVRLHLVEGTLAVVPCLWRSTALARALLASVASVVRGEALGVEVIDLGEGRRILAVGSWPYGRPDETQYCRRCGCSEHDACEGGCAWTEEDLCSACAAPAHLTARKERRDGSRESNH